MLWSSNLRRLTQLVTLEHTLFTTYIQSSILHNCPIQRIFFNFIFHNQTDYCKSSNTQYDLNNEWFYDGKLQINENLFFCLIFSSSIHELQNIWIKSTLYTITWCNLRIIAKRSNVTIMISFPFSIEGFIQTIRREVALKLQNWMQT